ncbi:MAG: cobalamin-independent methionine synthase II family protein [Dehalococcoidia bacterium]
MANKRPLFPVSTVGSWPRPPYLLEALHSRQDGDITFAEFNGVADGAVLEALRYQEEAGADIVSDGEQRRDNFYSFIVEKLDGVELMSLADIMDVVEDKASFEAILKQRDTPAFAIHNPTVTGRLKPRSNLALDEYLFLRDHTDKPIKVPLPGPYMLARAMWVDGITDKAYASKDELAIDLVRILRDELIALRDAGCEYVQFDEPVLSDVVFGPDLKERTFMCASMSASSGNPHQEMTWAARLMNAIVQGVDGTNIGLHICRGNFSRNEEALLNGGYEAMIRYLLIMQLDQLVLEYATPRAGGLDAFAPFPGMREIGLGVVNPRSDEIEPPDFVVRKVKDALQYFRPEQIFLNPDCGFGTFAERPMNAPDVAAQKIETIAVAARELRKEYA